MIPQSNYSQSSRSSWLKTTIYTLAFFLTCSTLSAQADSTCTAQVGHYKGTSVCFLETTTVLKVAYQTKAVTPEGFQVVYLLGYANHSGDQPVIQQIANEPLFPLPASPQGIYTVHELVYNPATLNLNSIALNESTVAKLKEALGGTCAALDTDGATVSFGECENSCSATAGRLVAISNPCVKGNEAILKAEVQSAPIIPAGYERLYALVNDADGEIMEFGSGLSFTVGVAGKYSIHTLVYDTATLNLDQLYESIGIVTLASIDTLLVQGGGTICGALDKIGATFEVQACPEPAPDTCQVSAGTLAVVNNPCIRDSGTVTIKAVTKDSPVVPPGSQVRYLLSTGAERRVQRIDTVSTFAISDTGQYRIHTLVYDPLTFNPDSLSLDSLTVAAIDSAVDSLCGAADVAGALFNVKVCPPAICSANAGYLISNDSTCLYNGKATLTAAVGIAPLEPFGYHTIYLLSAGDSSVIQKISATPSFEVTEAGRFSIHTLVYDTANIKIDSIHLDTTKVSELNALLLQGGGTFCAALDTTGAVFQLEVCADCAAKAGRLSSDSDPCLKDSTAILTAYNLELPVVPNGFKLAYLLTANKDGIVRQVSDSVSFEVHQIGEFTIHTLVYDLSVFSLDSIKASVTTIAQLNSLLVQGGGNMCGALDTKGFSYFVLPCPIECNVKAGSLESIGQTCISPGEDAIIEAAFVQQPMVPAGFVVRYLLSVGDIQIIRQISDSPSFAVSAVGVYTIHTLVYDPLELNLSNIQLGITSIGTVNSWLISGGGDACGALDTKGLSFDVWKCEDDCSFELGQLQNFNRFVCITNGGATLTTFIQSPAFVPSGYKLKYVLTFGDNLLIQQTSDNPIFRVNQPGRFTIHTLIYNPSTLGLSAVLPGFTSLNELNQQLIQGGGATCAGLDMEGVVFQVGLCAGDNSDDSQLRAYPNPSMQKVNLVLPYAEDVSRTTVELLNSNGDVVNQLQMEGYNPTLNIDISGVQPGVYYVRVYYDGKFVQQTSVIRAQ